MLNPRTVSAVAQKLSQQVYEHASQGRMVLTLGGDHSIAIGSISGTARAVRERLGQDIGVVWVDAHADINTPETSDSGNVHGMPVAWLAGLCREADPQLFGWLNEEADKRAAANATKTNGTVKDTASAAADHPTALADADAESTNHHGPANSVAAATNRATSPSDPKMASVIAAPQGVINLSKLVYIGLRDVDRYEKQILRKFGIQAYSMHDIDRASIGPVLASALAYLGPSTPIHLSFDVDALDPQWAPSTGTPVRGGLTLREGDFIAECVAETGRLVAMDLVEVNPALGRNAEERGETVRAGCSLVRCALGDTLL
jgi:arginase family enzyme